jgi:hypothetical protein
MTTVETYSTLYRDSSRLTDEQWETLRTYVEDLRTGLDRGTEEQSGVAEPDDELPRITASRFEPWGWIGEYPGGVRVTANQFNDTEEQQLLNDVGGWATMIGGTTFEAAFPLGTDVLVDHRDHIAGYSRALIELTEEITSERLPTTVTQTRHRGHAPDGRPVFRETMQARAQGFREIVTESIEFSFDTPANHLLVQFHAILAERMRTLAESYNLYADAFEQQLQYHDRFLTRPIPRDLFETAITADLTEPGLLSELRHGSTGPMIEIVNLWEAFQRNRSLELQIRNHLNTAVKPISKVFELWCLGHLLKTLEAITGEGASTSKIEGRYHFDDSVELSYNRPLVEQSEYFAEKFEVGPGEPDFALLHDGDVVWVGDAKCSTWNSLELNSYQRFCSYLLDLMPEGTTGSLLYVDTGRGISREAVRGYTVEHLPIRPCESEDSLNALKSRMGAALK